MLSISVQHGSVSREPQLGLERRPFLDCDRFIHFLHHVPITVVAIAAWIRGIGLIHVKIFLIDREDGESPRPALVVADRDAGEGRLAGADHVPAGSDQVHPVPERRQLHRSMRVVGHDRTAQSCVIARYHPVVASLSLGIGLCGFSIRKRLEWSRQIGAFATGAVPILVQRKNILGKKPNGHARCVIDVENRVADQGQVDRTIGFQVRLPGMKIEKFARAVAPHEVNELGILHLLGRVAEQAVVPGYNDLRRPFAGFNPQESELQWQPCRLAFGELDKGVDSRDEIRDDLVPPRVIMAQLGFHVSSKPQQTGPDVGE